MGTILDVGIDWLTFTMARECHEYAEWRSRCIDLAEHIQSAGNIAETTRRFGYDGVSTGHTFVGEREADGIAIVSSSVANTAFRYLWCEGVHVARLDVQVTVTGLITGKEPGIAARRQADEANAQKGAIGHRKVHVHDDSDGGYTLYVGSRSSPYFGRFYNKQAESPEDYPSGTWRYEVQAHNQVATHLAEQLMLMNGSLDAAIASCVWNWWRQRGVTPEFDPPPEDFLIEGPRSHTSDAERKLKWLREQVRPTVKLLLAIADYDILMEALGVPIGGRQDLPLTDKERGG